MIQRYLGNKTSIIDSILEEVDLLCVKNDYVCDIFAGTMSVSVNLKKHGYKVIANDISSFSYIFGDAYVKNNTIPEIDLVRLGIDQEFYSKLVENVFETYFNSPKEAYSIVSEDYKQRIRQFIIILQYLETIPKSAILKRFRHNFFFDYYTEVGAKSNFLSSRGTKGKRKYFSPANGKRLDIVLNKILEWKSLNLIDDVLYRLLISVVLVSIEKVSNTQGTFHDFIRNDYDSRALNPLKLLVPDFNFIISEEKPHFIGRERDSMEFIETVPKHKVLYIDPPYNFRQYTSYYFMLNLISDYCEIDDLNSYFSKVKYVRGQNMEKDFSSTFCKNSMFISSLEELIRKAPTEWVIMSYFNGRNHKSDNLNDKENILVEIEEFFRSDLFESETLKIKHVERTNYQSYGGHNAGKVNEILYIVKKSLNELD